MPSSRLAGALLFVAVAALLAGPDPVLAVPGVEDRLQELERQVAELRAAVARARDGGTDREELERRIDLLAAEIEKLKLGEAAVEADGRRFGLGPAASKIYRKTSGASLAGYGELLYQNFDGSRDDGTPSGRTDEIDLLRGILYVGYRWNDRWLFNSELEVEHAQAGDGAEGEVALEFAYVERQIRPAINARAGLLLVPMGLVNELHEPTVFLGARRPRIETAILPTTWRENGAGVFGDLGPVSYRGYVLAGLDAARFSAAGLRGGRQHGSKSQAEDLAWVARADWSATPGLLVGGSFYRGDSGQGIEAGDGRRLAVGTTIFEGHVEWRWRGLELRGLACEARLGGVTALNDALSLVGPQSIGKRQRGSYVQAGYDVMPHLGGEGALILYLRAESYDTQHDVPSGFTSDPANDVEVVTLGLAWKPLDQVVVKLDFEDADSGAGTGVDQFNAALGYVF